MLVGEHDFRNFCKLHPVVTNFVRVISLFEIRRLDCFQSSGNPVVK